MKLGLVCLGIMVVLLSVSFASAQLSTDWRLIVDGVEALDNTTVTTLYSGQNNNIRLVYKAVHDAEDVRLVMQLYNSSGQFVGSKATQRFNIIQNTYYSTMLPFLVPAGISTRDTYVGHIALENDNESDNNNYPMIIRIELSDCQTLNQTNGHYILKQDILVNNTTYGCFKIMADNITIDLNSHTLKGNLPAYSVGVFGDYPISSFSIFNGTISSFFRGIRSSEFYDSRIENVNFVGNMWHLNIAGGANNLIINNKFLNNIEWVPSVYLSENDFSRVINNSFINNSHGMVIDGGSNNIIEGGIFTKTAGYGGKALTIAGSSNNVITDVTFSENDFGLKFNGQSEYNLVYNNFFNNTQNIYIDHRVNYFNTYMHKGKNIIGGRFLGGNFWAQPNGKGFSETCKDGNFDGLCDKSYVINENNFDEIPLARKNKHDPIPDY